LSVYPQTHPNKVARQLDERPRKTLHFETPAERSQLLSTEQDRAASGNRPSSKIANLFKRIGTG
jgi:hypothetical protein